MKPHLRDSVLGAVCACGFACTSARFSGAESERPHLVFPARYEAEDGGAPASAARADAAAPATPAGSSPDPMPLRTPLQWEYQFRYRHGALSVTRVRRLRFDQPVVTARRIGRFAVELWIGRELVERVRFDFPMLAAEPPPMGARRPLHAAPELSAGADVSQIVLVPMNDRATRAMLVDRATGGELVLPWPPGPSAVGGDAGTTQDGGESPR